jgi:hypothetical protein
VTKKEKSRPGDCSTRTAAETAACERAAVPYEDCTMSAAVRQIRIADLLPHGAENGVNLHHLEKMTGLDGREVRRQIERERRAGALIVSNNKDGYYLTDDPAEAQRFARSMQHRAREILRTARAIEEAAGVD